VRASKACSTIDTRANVCSVRYCPWDSNYLAVGSAAHAVLLYDLRRAGGTAAPLANLSGHSKAVSYVRWASATELVSASTDNTLRLWSVKGWISPNESHAMGAASPCLRTYSGHVNERNFVGLSVQNDLIAAGSETNEVSPCV
jgi:WD40 repeat protein